MATERIFFFSGSLGRRLLGVLYRPDSPVPGGTGIVYCHPFTEEHNMSHTAMVKVCRALSGIGYPVLRFDMSGCGDSEGELTEVEIPSWMEDLDAAVEALRAETGARHAALLGLRLGGGLALLRAQEDPAVPFLVLWEPVLDFALYIRQFMRRAIASEIVGSAGGGTTVAGLEKDLADRGEVNVIGYPITRALFDSFLAVSRRPVQQSPRCPVLVLSISQGDRPSFALGAYRDMLEGAGAEVSFDHIQAEPFWDRYWRWECPEAATRTVRWAADIGRRG
ncbi:MAG TPA: alpha/beta hydrolase [Deltaproteobacteria bacterium]|jgi:exosortase A-associated hydrolase 2|nr:alpha/beta hydrolase [Deltaproteobacteria bacterium]HOI08232.1 alpha/beta hydrolase [Deltaproteobacteria bacterium]